MEKFVLSDSDLHLLLEFENNPSIEALSKALAKDPTVISRQLKRISEQADVLVKISGRWTLNDAGRRLNQSTRDFIKTQNAILSKEKLIRIGTNREFAARVVAKNFASLKDSLAAHSILLNAYESGVEQALLSGEIDIGFDCGRPNSPEVQFKHIFPEEIAVVVSQAFAKKFLKPKITLLEVMELPHIFCERLDPAVLIGPANKPKHVAFTTNDIASVRAGCIASIGWAFLPTYTIQQELDAGTLKIVEPFSYTEERYGVWKLRARKHLQSEFDASIEWLKSLELK